jgi:hypothetical protein
MEDKTESTDLKANPEESEAAVEWQELRNETMNVDNIGSLLDRYDADTWLYGVTKIQKADPKKLWLPTEVGYRPQINNTSHCPRTVKGTYS